MCQAALAFANQPVPKGGNVGVITNTGGPAIIAVDELIAAGLKLPPLSKDCEKTLKEKLHPAASIDNPIDLLATGSADHFRAALDALEDEPGIDSILINFVTPFFVDTDSIAKQIAEVDKATAKPIVCNLMTDKRQWTETIRILKEGGVPCYSFPETAARALVAMTRYGELKAREFGEVKTFDDVDREKAKKIIQGAKDAKREFLSAEDVFGLLESYNIPVAKWNVVECGDEAIGAASEIGFPVAVKVDSEKIIHKHDVGGVVVNIGEDKIKSVVDGMEKKFLKEKPRYLVQEYVPQGLELIVGAKTEERLGHLVVFGMGGVQVELLKDVAFGITPLTAFEAKEMMSSIKSYPLLSGFRGKKGVNQDKLVEIIQRVSQLVADIPIIKEMDLNPVIAQEERVCVVDARIGI